MEWIEPVDVKSTVKFSSLATTTDFEQQKIIHGSISENDLAWFASGDRLDVVSTTHSGVQSRHFQCPQGQEFQVTCVAAIPNEPLALVGLSSSTGSGAVALYNYVTSLILNSWSISHKVTCVCSMEIPNSNYKQFLKSDCFLFALGTEEGHVMLLAVDQHFKFSAGTHQLDLNIVHYATTDDVIHKRMFFKPPVVLVIPLNDPMYRAGKFVLESMHETRAVLSVRQEEVSATVVRYISQNQTLCVGYNIQGAFQLFSLKTLDLDFSGFAQGCNGEKLEGILDFVFLEPEDDPRHFCYLMIVAQRAHTSHSAPYALLYSLTYVHKDNTPEGGILYEDLQYITLRLDLNFQPLILTDERQETGEDIKLVICKSLPSYQSPSVNSNSTRATSCYGMCYVAMCWNKGIYLVVFDLNQWYQAQMPSRWIFDDMSQLCPFMGFYHTQTSTDLACQAWIQSETLSIFHRSSTSPSEAFFYPSALSFRAIVIHPVEAEIVLFLGAQSLLLQKLSQAGSQILCHPHRFYVQAMKAGLTPNETVAPQTHQMAEALLSIGLENNSRSFLISCIKDEGANLNFVEKWAWQQVLNLKSLRESLCHALFDHSTQEMEHQMHNQLYHVTHQFNNLAVLYDVMDKRIRALNSGVNDKLRDKCRAIYLLSLHLETVLWFLHGGLLPETDEGDETGSSLPFPRHQLEQFYRRRKTEIENLSSSVRASEVLLIHQLVPGSVIKLWTEERGSNEIIYPPPSLYALLSAYLRPDVDDVTKHRLVQYLFMDLTWIYGRHPHYGNILQHLVTFPSTYSLKPSMIKVTQAFWHLDHQNFDDALGMLLDPIVHAMDITNAQQRAILRSFLYQDKRRHALKYATLRQPVCPELEDIQLHLTILIANNLISDALGYIRRNRNQRNSTDLIQHFLQGCQEMRKISVLLTLPLTDDEEEHVTNFLKRSGNIDLQEALLLFYIQRCKYPDAIAYSQRLNQMWPSRDAISRERFNRREMLMQTLISALPPITCKLAAIANSRPSTSSGSGKFPRPLSVSVLPTASKVQTSSSNFFQTVLEQSRATWLIEQRLHQEVQTPLRTRKRKADIGENEQPVVLEATPFLCNIVQPPQRNVTLGMSLCFPSPMAGNSLTMDGTELEADETQPKQGKRPRYSLFPKPKLAKTDAEVVSVLQTPPIHRSRPSFAEISSSSSRPSSILKDKMRRFMNFSTFEGSQRAASDVDPSESETDIEISTIDSSAKQLRFNLPQLASPTESAPEAIPVASDEDDMEIAEETIKSNVAEDSQFLSFEEEKEAVLPETHKDVLEVQVEDAQPTMTHVLVEDVEHIEMDNLETEVTSVGMEITNLDVPTLQATFYGADTESRSITNLEPVPSYEEPLQPPQSDEESDIVCLDSSSEESYANQQYDKEEEDLENGSEEEEIEHEEEEYAIQQEEEDEDEIAVDEEVEEEEEHVEEEKSDVDEEEEEEGERIALRKDETEEVKDVDDEEVVNDVEDSDNSRDEDVAKVESEIYVSRVEKSQDWHQSHIVTSDERFKANFNEDVAEVQEDVSESMSYVEDREMSEPHDSESSQGLLPDVATAENRQLSEIEHRSTVTARLAIDLRGDSSNDSEDVEACESNQEDNEQAMRSKETSDDDSSSDAAYGNYSTAAQQTISTSYKQRFAMSSSEEEVSDEEDNLVNMSLRKPVASGYSQIEPDLDADFDIIDTPQQDSETAPELEKVYDDDINTENEVIEEGTANRLISSYSQIEPDLEYEEPQQQNTVCEEAQQLTMLPIEENLVEDAPPSCAGSCENTCAEMPSGEEECQKRDTDEEEEEEFELKLTETPTSNVKRRSSRHRKLSLSSLISSDEEKGDDKTEEIEKTKLVVDPEMSPMCYMGTDNPDSPSYQEGKQKFRTQRSSIFHTRLQLSDSESSSESEISEEQPYPLQTTAVESMDVQKTGQKIGDTELPESPAPQVDIRETDKSPTNVSVYSEGSTTDENEDLKNILQRHTAVQIPLIPDAAIIPSSPNLSTIVEERSFDQSIAAGLVKAGKSSLGTLEEEMNQAVESEEETPQEITPTTDEVVTQPEEIEQETEMQGVTEAVAQGSETEIQNVDQPKEDTFEPLQPLSSDEEDAVEVSRRLRNRTKSMKFSQVPLPFTSRRSLWEGDRDRSPDSATSEPPQFLEETGATSTGRRRRHSTTNVTSASVKVATRRSKRLSSSVSEGLDTVGTEEVATASYTPQKSTRKRSSVKGQGDMDMADSSVPPSLDVSPADSTFSGRSSAPGTPMRRSARLALRDRTPEPSASTDVLLTSLGRIRRHSTGPTDVSSPLRRSGRKSINLSRDNSPDSVTSEPPPRTEVTPSRRKPSRTLKSAQKSVALNLFPVDEEAELNFDAARKSLRDFSVARDSDESTIHEDEGNRGESSEKPKRPRSRKLSGKPKQEAARDSDESTIHEDEGIDTRKTKEETGKRSRRPRSRQSLSEPVREVSVTRDSDDSTIPENDERKNKEANVEAEEKVKKPRSRKLSSKSVQEHTVLPDSDESTLRDDEDNRSTKAEPEEKSRRPRSRQSSVSSSPVSSSRYNLRRPARTAELDIISEEGNSKNVDSTYKRVREENSEESADQSEQQEEEVANEKPTKRAGPKKKQKKTDESPESSVTEDIHFAPVSRPPPKNLPKREPAIKSRTSVRRSMRLDK